MATYVNMLRASALAASVLAGVGGANAATVVGGSDLITGAALSQIESWLVDDPQLGYNGPLQFTNIFDKALGSTAADFHAAVDGKGPTIVLMEVTLRSNPEVGVFVIGGFNPQSWQTGNVFHMTPNAADRTAFIFNLTTGERRDQLTNGGNGSYQTYNSSSFGPYFGLGPDFYANTDLASGYLRAASYCVDPGVPSCASDANLVGMTADTYINIAQLEVFTIQEAPLDQTPLPGALPLFASGLGALGLAAWRRGRRTGW